MIALGVLSASAGKEDWERLMQDMLTQAGETSPLALLLLEHRPPTGRMRQRTQLPSLCKSVNGVEELRVE
jgi:hypothetical protein